MSVLAIKGHKTRGKEVIALLGILGGMNTREVTGDNERCCYYLNSENTILEGLDPDGSRFLSYTLEEFEKLYPYKLRDKVLYKDVSKWNVHWIKGMEWIDNEIQYQIDYGEGFRLTHIKTKYLRPYVEEEKWPSFDNAKAPVLQGQDFSGGRCSYKIPEGFEFDKVEGGEIILKPKKKELPRTYGECCEVLGMQSNLYLQLSSQAIGGEVEEHSYGYGISHKMNVLYELLVCRDAYWKLADGWKPAYGLHDKKGYYYNLTAYGCGIVSEFCDDPNKYRLLMFPTAKMRDTFYENFKDLIHECKELL